MLVVLPAPLTPTTMITVGVCSPTTSGRSSGSQQLVDARRRAGAATAAGSRTCERASRALAAGRAGASVARRRHRPAAAPTSRSSYSSSSISAPTKTSRSRRRCAAGRPAAWRASRRALSRLSSAPAVGAACPGKRACDSGGRRRWSSSRLDRFGCRREDRRRRGRSGNGLPGLCRLLADKPPASAFHQPNAPRGRSRAAATCSLRVHRQAVALAFGAASVTAGSAGAAAGAAEVGFFLKKLNMRGRQRRSKRRATRTGKGEAELAVCTGVASLYSRAQAL